MLFKRLALWFILSFVAGSGIATLWAAYYFGLSAGINFGIKTGLEIAIPITLFAYVFLRAQKSIVPTGDTVLRMQANLFRGIEAVGGHITLTHTELVFEPHILNVQSQISSIPLADIKSVSKKNTLGLIPNGIVVTTQEDKKYQFVLWHRNAVINFIEELSHK